MFDPIELAAVRSGSNGVRSWAPIRALGTCTKADRASECAP